MIGFARRPRRFALRAGALLTVLALLIAAFGCGSSDDTTVAGSGPATGSDIGDAAGSGAAQGKSEQASGKSGLGGAGNANGVAATVGADGGGKNAKTGSRADGAHSGDTVAGEGADKKSSKHSAAIEGIAARHCPKGVDLSQCEALAEDAEQAKNAPSYVVTAPDDCLKAMSQDECEALYAAQKQAAEANGASVDVQACLRNPTPECEAVVRPLAEQQRAAEEAGR